MLRAAPSWERPVLLCSPGHCVRGWSNDVSRATGSLLLFPAGEVPAVLVGLLADGDVIAALEFLDEII